MNSNQLSKENGSWADYLLKRIPFFAGLSDEEYLELRRIIKVRHYKKNEVILFEEQTSDFMYVVYSGKVKAVKTDEDGREKILAIHQKGDFFGEMTLLDGRTSPAIVVAVEPAIIGLIRKADFEEYLFEHDKALKAVLALLCSRLREAWSMLKILTFADEEHRVRAMLYELGIHYGKEDKKGTLIRTRLTHRDIARYATVTRETVTRLLNKFSKAGEIEILNGRAILLKPKFFEKIQFL